MLFRLYHCIQSQECRIELYPACEGAALSPHCLEHRYQGTEQPYPGCESSCHFPLSSGFFWPKEHSLSTGKGMWAPQIPEQYPNPAGWRGMFPNPIIIYIRRKGREVQKRPSQDPLEAGTPGQGAPRLGQLPDCRQGLQPNQALQQAAGILEAGFSYCPLLKR